MNRTLGRSLLALGLVFLVLGLVQQGFTLSFESGFFNLGLIFALSGIVASALYRRSAKS